MCCLYGLMDRSHRFTARERSTMINCLARASEARGTDATGIAYISRNRMRIYKRPMAAHKLRLRVPAFCGAERPLVRRPTATRRCNGRSQLECWNWQAV